MEHLMLDIETLDTKPGAVMLSVAAVQFDIATGEIGREFFRKIDLADSMSKGFKLSADTLRWWLEQNPEVLKQNVTIPKGELANSTIDVVMKDLADFFKFYMPPDIQVWGNSNRFDMGILIPYIEVAGFKNLWKYSKERDVRTLVAFAPAIKEQTIAKAKEDKLDLHNPIVDCKVQIDYCSQIYKSLKH